MNYKYFLVLLGEYYKQYGLFDLAIVSPNKFKVTKLTDVGKSKVISYTLTYVGHSVTLSIEEIKALLKKGN